MNTCPPSVDIAIGFSSHDFNDCLKPNTRTMITIGSYLINDNQTKGTFLVQYYTNKTPLELFFPNATPKDIKSAISAAGLPLNEVKNHANTYFTGDYQFT